jgi:hypothetical protein
MLGPVYCNKKSEYSFVSQYFFEKVFDEMVNWRHRPLRKWFESVILFRVGLYLFIKIPALCQNQTEFRQFYQQQFAVQIWLISTNVIWNILRYGRIFNEIDGKVIFGHV